MGLTATVVRLAAGPTVCLVTIYPQLKPGPECAPQADKGGTRGVGIGRNL